ncbi:MAG: hypothetical protein F6J92_41305, partial [Symploca sp. SIO1A3]|nr:hypothetical protein [Symploca sp. SIO1A3]
MTLDNQPINSHITDYLNYYCGLAHAPGFAVLLKGQWGAGKTWFIKKYCENLKKNKQKCLYISLYGMTSFAEIEYALLTKEIMSPQASDSVTEENNEERTPIQTILKKYPTLNLHDPFPNLVWWEIFFDKGIIDTQELENSLSTNKYFQD